MFLSRTIQADAKCFTLLKQKIIKNCYAKIAEFGYLTKTPSLQDKLPIPLPPIKEWTGGEGSTT